VKYFKISTLLSLLLLFASLSLGIFFRVWDFANLPAGLNQDEASIAVEAASLYYYGVDRNSQSYPVHFISWGSGQNVPYAYLLMPLVPLGLSTAVIRLPMLITGILTLILVYWIARKAFTPTVAIFCLLLVAISPWHIMLSRWALESNLFPFAFGLAFLLMLYTDRSPYWFLVGSGVLALALYVYGTSYFIVPLFFAIVAVANIISHRISWRILLLGMGVFVLLAIPISLFVLANSLGLGPMHLGPVTIPMMPAGPRYEAMVGLLHGAGLKWYRDDLLTTARILLYNTDDRVYDLIPPFGYLFPGAILFSMLGLFLIVGQRNLEQRYERYLFLGWLTLAVLLGIIMSPTAVRINIIFLPLIICAGVALEWITSSKKILFLPVGIGLFVYTFLFWREYTGEDFRTRIGQDFRAGLIPAIQLAQNYPDSPVCFDSSQYIYVELVDRQDPRKFVSTIEYLDPTNRFRIVTKMGRYAFGLDHCPRQPDCLYILPKDMTPPGSDIPFRKTTFDNYTVFVPAVFPPSPSS
jgi:hypothetical protein